MARARRKPPVRGAPIRRGKDHHQYGRSPPRHDRGPHTYPALLLGEAHPTSKLNIARVQRIRRLLAEGNLSAPKIAALVGGITASTVYHIRYGATWAWLPPPPRVASRSLTRAGENKAAAKLTNAKVREIRSLLLKQLTITAIARSYGVSRPVIRAIRDGKAWTHVKE